MNKMRNLFVLALVLGVALTLAPAARAADAGVYGKLMEHYEPIREALLNDSLDGVADHAAAIEETAARLQADLTAKKAGVPEAKLQEVQALLPDVVGAAGELAEAGDLEEARRLFGELSEAMVLYHGLVPGAEMMVAYCPMVEESWLQPEGDLGNPYMGQKMARCGKKASD